MDKQRKAMAEKEAQRLMGEVVKKLTKFLYRKLQDKKKGRKTIAKAGGRKAKKK